MPNESIYTPYFYIIQDTRNGKYYAGARWAKDANPLELLRANGYKTSSNIVKKIIQRDGIHSFTIRKIKTFSTQYAVEKYEKKFLNRINARNNSNFYNMHNGDLLCGYGSQKYKIYMRKTYGVEHPMHSEKLKNKMKETNLERYGVENPFQSEEIKEKICQTNLERYGVENPFQSEEIKEKIKQTNLERYGFVSATQSAETKRNKIKTNLEKYGKEHPLQTETSKNKMRETNLERYGVENPFQSEEIKEKIKQTNMKKYGVEHALQSEKIQEKYKETSMLKFGVENPFQSEEIKEKICQTNLERYGVRHSSQSEEIKRKKRESTERLLSRSQLDKIRKYKKKYKFSIGCGWVRKSDKFLDDTLTELIERYGII